jgi:hypothetical protein
MLMNGWRDSSKNLIATDVTLIDVCCLWTRAAAAGVAAGSWLRRTAQPW